MFVIYHCKKCKTAKRVEYIQEKKSIYRINSKGQRVPAGIWIMACGGGKPTVYGGDVENGLCPTCGKMMKYGEIKAVTTDHVCDARCTNATGHKCECSCGGVNHGLAYA